VANTLHLGVIITLWHTLLHHVCGLFTVFGPESVMLILHHVSAVHPIHEVSADRPRVHVQGGLSSNLCCMVNVSLFFHT
jgi:hypothetical protein